MIFKTTGVDINGTHLQGYVLARYSDLVKIFGEPQEADGYKVSSEWEIEFADGTVASIYDYKETSLYDRDYPSPKNFRIAADKGKGFEWHIGGHNKAAVARVYDALNIAAS